MVTLQKVYILSILAETKRYTTVYIQTVARMFSLYIN